MKSITKIVITGGPCGGKTSSYSSIISHYSALGYAVLIVHETATDLISSGVSPITLNRNIDFQYAVCSMQRTKEQVYLQAANNMPNEKIIIVCDRGLADNFAYMDDEDSAQILKYLGMSKTEVFAEYDAVFHLVSAAKGAEEFYDNSNSARTETISEASERDDKLIEAWVGHPHLRIIDNSTNFSDKMQRLLDEIDAFIGIPTPLEVERRYLVQFPDLDMFDSMRFCSKISITQSYIKLDGVSTRLRKRGDSNGYMYIMTQKKPITDITRVEIEKQLTYDEYEQLLREHESETLTKTRYCFLWKNQYFELDIYPFWNDRAILELELMSEEQPYELPDFLNIIRDLSGDMRYTNHSIARTHDLPIE